MSADTTKFDWKASESAPENYPMQIIRGNLHYHGDASGDGLYVPSGGRINVTVQTTPFFTYFPTLPTLVLQ